MLVSSLSTSHLRGGFVRLISPSLFRFLSKLPNWFLNQATSYKPLHLWSWQQHRLLKWKGGFFTTYTELLLLSPYGFVVLRPLHLNKFSALRQLPFVGSPSFSHSGNPENTLLRFSVCPCQYYSAGQPWAIWSGWMSFGYVTSRGPFQPKTWWFTSCKANLLQQNCLCACCSCVAL